MLGIERAVDAERRRLKILKRLGGNIEAGNRGTLFGQQPSRSVAQATSGPGYEGDSSFKTSHVWAI